MDHQTISDKEFLEIISKGSEALCLSKFMEKYPKVRKDIHCTCDNVSHSPCDEIPQWIRVINDPRADNNIFILSDKLVQQFPDVWENNEIQEDEGGIEFVCNRCWNCLDGFLRVHIQYAYFEFQYFFGSKKNLRNLIALAVLRQ
jgi:hypothetical protein